MLARPFALPQSLDFLGQILPVQRLGSMLAQSPRLLDRPGAVVAFVDDRGRSPRSGGFLFCGLCRARRPRLIETPAVNRFDLKPPATPDIEGGQFMALEQAIDG